MSITTDTVADYEEALHSRSTDRRAYSKPSDIYHPANLGAEQPLLRLTMVDVRRLLADQNVVSFDDLRTRDLVPLLEARVTAYLREGGHIVTTNPTYKLTDMAALDRVGGAEPIPFEAVLSLEAS